MSASVLVVAAHADDEILGCGGTLSRHVQSGDRVAAIHMTDGVGSRPSASLEDARAREQASDRAAAVIGFDWIARGEFPDNGMDSVPLLEVVRFVEDGIDAASPNLVYTHHGGDLNIDHQIAFRATLTALRPVPDSPPVEIRAFEVPSSTEWSHRSVGPAFTPSLFVEITEQWVRKREALKCYQDELFSGPHPRSVESVEVLARRRGAQAGLEKAEAFELIRQIQSEVISARDGSS